MCSCGLTATVPRVRGRMEAARGQQLGATASDPRVLAPACVASEGLAIRGGRETDRGLAEAEGSYRAPPTEGAPRVRLHPRHSAGPNR